MSVPDADAATRLEVGTALEQAARRNDLATITSLLDGGADINARGDIGWTALMRAAERGHCEVARLLCERGADVNIQTDQYTLRTALNYTVRNGHLEVASLLLDYGAKMHGPFDGSQYNLLMSAMGGRPEYKRPQVLALLLDRGADPNARCGDDPQGTTLLYSMSLGGDEACARVLLDHGADVNAGHHDGDTPLLCALSWSTGGLARLFIEYCPDVNVGDDSGRTPLMQAVLSRNLWAAEALLIKGADVNARRLSDGMTALGLAVAGEFPEVVPLLRQAGAVEYAPSSTSTGTAAIMEDAKEEAEGEESKEGEKPVRPVPGGRRGQREYINEYCDILLGRPRKTGDDYSLYVYFVNTGELTPQFMEFFGIESVCLHVLDNGSRVTPTVYGPPFSRRVRNTLSYLFFSLPPDMTHEIGLHFEVKDRRLLFESCHYEVTADRISFQFSSHGLTSNVVEFTLPKEGT